MQKKTINMFYICVESFSAENKNPYRYKVLTRKDILLPVYRPSDFSKF